MSKAQIDDELYGLIEWFYRKVFEHAMALGQEFPEDNPATLFDPCNADNRRELEKELIAWSDRRTERAVKKAELDACERLASSIINRFDLIAHLNNDPTAHGFTPAQLCKALQEHIPVKKEAVDD